MLQTTASSKPATKIVAASSAALLLLLAACGEDRADTVSSGDGDGTSQTPVSVKTPAKIKLAAGANQAPSAAGRAESTVAADTAGDADGKMAGSSFMPQHITYVAGSSLADLTGARTSWFFPKDGHVVTDAQKAVLAGALGLTGEWAPLPADWGGGLALGPTDGTGANITISTDAMASWWYNPSPQSFPASEPCTTSVDAGTGEERTECPTPVPPANVPDKATAESKARDLFAALGYDASQFEFEAYADDWGAWVTAWLLLDGQRAPITMYAGFGAEGALTGAGGFLARPIQGDQYDLVGIAEGIERLNDQQFGWIGLGASSVARSAEVDVATGGGSSGSSGGAESDVDATTTPEGIAVGEPNPSGDVEPAPPADPGTDGGPATDVMIDPMPCEIAIRPTGDAPVDSNCVPVEVQPITVTLTGVKADLTMVWDAEGTVWLLPAYTFTADDGGQYSVIAIDDAFIELPEALPVPEPMPIEATDPVADPDIAVDPPVAIEVDQGAADSLLGLTEDEALKLAESNHWIPRIVARDGEQFAITMDFRTDRVNLTIDGGVVTAVSLG